MKRQVGDKKVLTPALSGGVDSSVVAALLIKASGGDWYACIPSHGLMRKNESECCGSLPKSASCEPGLCARCNGPVPG